MACFQTDTKALPERANGHFNNTTQGIGLHVYGLFKYCGSLASFQNESKADCRIQADVRVPMELSPLFTSCLNCFSHTVVALVG